MTGRPRVVIFASAGSLRGLSAALRRAGVRSARLVSLEVAGVPPARWLPPPNGPVVLVVTSRHAVRFGFLPWKRSRPRAAAEIWAAGPGTASALRRAGARNVREGRPVGAEGIVRALARQSPSRIVHLRSDLAGPDLAEALRAQGHEVVDAIVYRVRPARLPPTARALLRGADLLLVSSPSGVSGLVRGLPASELERVRRSARLVVLGGRSRTAARRAGFRRVSVAPSTAPQRLTRHLLRELRHARS